ncbi:MAG: RNA polymerase factor sigma-54 [Kiritimatiellae bacterium]|nr:RNA polymerase factor sigma-54 [Kiritimatiellia bacterium]
MPIQSLSLHQSQRQKQTMTMSPLQRQSLDILQLPLMALEQKIREEAESNPAIEEVVSPSLELDAPPIDRDGLEAEAEASENDDDIQIHDAPSPAPAGDDAEERRRYMFESLRQPVSLEQHLRSQILTSDFTPEEESIAETLVANLSSTGLLAVTTAEVAEVTGAPIADVERTLAKMQAEFDPPGIAARSASERIVLQLRATPRPATPLAERIARDCIDDLAAGGREAAIASRLGATREAVSEAIALIKALPPNPVAEFDAIAPTDYVIPEIEVVRDKSGRWVAQYDADTAPRIVVNESLRQYLEDDSMSADDKSYIREHLHGAEALARSLEQRSETILRVGQAIVEHQQDFFNFGVSRLKPLTLGDVAAKIGRHETTVSRAAAGKYMRSPRGIFELRYFFSSGVRVGDGDGASALSNKAVMEKIASLVKGENPENPYSDQELTDILVRGGVDIKRRTVAKYRDILHIPTSSRRRRRQ